MPRVSVRAFNTHTEGPVANKLDEHDTALDALETGSGTLPADTAPADVNTAAAIGVGIQYAREDHVHAIADLAVADGKLANSYAILAGRAGGQNLKGGTAASEGLLLTSTAHATKGKVSLGSHTTGVIYDEALNALGIGDAAGAGHVARIVTATERMVAIENPTGTLYSRLSIAGSARECSLYTFGGTYAASPFFGLAGANSVQLVSVEAAFMALGLVNAADVVIGTTNLPRFRARADGDLVVGNGTTAPTVLATGATAGFLRLTTSAGTPTGAAVDGSIHIDTTNHKLYFRSGATWRDAGP